MRISILFLGLALLAPALPADTLRLTDGSSLSGKVTELPDGAYKVATAAGEITVPADKVAAVVADAPAASSAGRNAYVEGVLERRRAYGNEDGLPRAANLRANQLMLTLGQLQYTGDAFSATASDLAGLSYGLAWAHSYTDFIAAELWGDYSQASKDYTVSGNATTLKLQRYNVGVGPKVQFATRVGRVESGMTLIPNLGLGLVWSGAQGSASGPGITPVDYNSSSVGAALSAGLDFQFGGAVLALKGRYLLTSDVTGSLKNTNTSAFLPQLGVGFNF